MFTLAATAIFLNLAKANILSTYPSNIRQQENILTSSLDEFYNQSEFAGTLFACKVMDSDGKVLYERNDSLRLVPASNNKLFGCSFALNKLGLDYRPETKFWKEPNGLYIRAEGDPMMQLIDIQNILHQLGDYNHTNIYLSEAYNPGYNPDWEFGDLPNIYAAPVTAFTINRAGLYLVNKNGKPALEPQSFGIKIIWTNRKADQFSDQYDPFKKLIQIEGKLPNKKELDTLSIPDPDIKTAKYFGSKVTFTSKLPSRKPDLVHEGMPLKNMMQLCLQISDNNLAESFLLMAGSRTKDLGTSYDPAISELNDFLFHTVGLNPVDITEDDGSGLSRENNVSSNAIADLLYWHEKQPNFQDWLTLLDHPGTGTMTNRLTDVPFRGKTGSMTRISALSGYINPLGTKPVVISLIEDNYQCSLSQMKELENKFVRIVFKSLGQPKQDAN